MHQHPRSRRWCFTYRDTASGRYVHKLTTTESKTEAKDQKIAFLAELQQGMAPGDAARWTVERAADHWLALREATSQSKRTLRKDRAIMRSLKKHLGGMRLDRITTQVIEQHQVRRLKEIAPAQINRELLFLVILLRKAKLWHRIEDDYRPLKINREVTGRALAPNQARFLLEVAASKREWNIAGWCAALALNTGLRGGELKQITLGAIQAKPPALLVGRSTTKTDSGARRIPLNPFASWAIEQLQNRAFALGASEANHYLLPGCNSRHTKPEDPLHGAYGYDPTRPQESLYSAWQSLCAETAKRWQAKYPDSKDAPFSGLRFHDLRHSFATRMGEAGIPLTQAMAILGHMSTSMTLWYTHLSDATTRPIMEMVQQISGMNVPQSLTIGREEQGGAY